MVDVIVSGANGNMGKVVTSTIHNEGKHNLVALYDPRFDNSQEGNKKNNIKELPDADLLIEFCSSESVRENTLHWLKHYNNIIIGSSGLTKKDYEMIEDELKRNQMIWVIPNFSIGAILQKKWSIEASKYYKNVTIEERHHAEKKDWPSGTSYDLAINLDSVNTPNPSDEKFKTIVNGIQISSLRDDKYLAEQKIEFSATDEVVTLEHISKSRESFLKGLILAINRYDKLTGFNVGLETIIE